MGSVNLELVEGAALPPQTCMFCATNPRDERGKSLPFVTAVGMDINWGETPYICATCCGIISDLTDRPDGEKVKAVLRGAKLQKKHNKKLTEENEELRKGLKAVLDGKEATEKAKELVNGN